jgi:DNA-binding MarR family transcriptional regulator
MVAPLKAINSGTFQEPHDYKADKSPLDPLFSDEIDYLIRMVRMREIYAIELMLEPMGLGLSAWYPLAVLHVKDGMSQRELGVRLNLKDAAIGKAIDALEKAGIVERRKDADDRRKALVCLTEEGQKAGRKIAKLRKQFRTVVVDGLSPSEQALLKGMLERVYRNIDQSVKA